MPAPFAANLSESASMPYEECSAQPLTQVAPLDRGRTTRSERNPGDCAKGATTKVEDVFATQGQTQDSGMYKGAEKAGNPVEDVATARRQER